MAGDTKWVYAFGDGKAEGKSQMRNLLGGKGANLAEMSNLGCPCRPASPSPPKCARIITITASSTRRS